MQVGDTVPVMIAGDVAAQAKIVSMEEGVATLIIPATQVRMKYVTQLTTEGPDKVEPSKQVIIDDIVRTPSEPVVEAVESATPVETTNVEVPAETASESISGTDAAVATPVGEATQTEVTAPDA